MEARPSAVVFFSFFRRVYARDILLSRRRLLLLLLHRCLLLLLLLDFVTRARKGRGREPKPNETRFSLIRSTSSNPQRGTRIRARTRTHVNAHLYAGMRMPACTRIYIRKRIHARSLSLAPALLCLVRAGSTLSYSLFPPFSLHPPPTAGRSLSTSSSNSISPLDRLSRRLSCTSSVSFLRLVSSPRSPSVSLLRPSCSLARTTYQLGG